MRCGPLLGVVVASLLAVGASGEKSAVAVQRIWSAPVGQARGASIVALHDLGDLVLAVDARGGVTALRARDGRLAWFLQLEGPATLTPGVRSGGGDGDRASGPAALALSTDARVELVDGRSGRRLRHLRMPSPLARAAVCDDDRLYAPLVLDHAVLAIDLNTGREAWTLRLPAPLAAPLMRVGAAGWVAWLDDGSLRGFSPHAHGASEVWVRREGRPAGPPAVDGGQVLIATDARTLLALDGASGRVAWRWSSPETLSGGPIPVEDVVVVAGDGSTFAVRGGRDGGPPAIAWKVQGETPVTRLGSSVVMRGRDGVVLRRRAGDGARLAGNLPDAALWVGGVHAVTVDGEGRLGAWTESR